MERETRSRMQGSGKMLASPCANSNDAVASLVEGGAVASLVEGGMFSVCSFCPFLSLRSESSVAGFLLPARSVLYLNFTISSGLKLLSR